MIGRVFVIGVKYSSMEDKLNILGLPIQCPEIFQGTKTLRLFPSYSNAEQKNERGLMYRKSAQANRKSPFQGMT